MMREAVSKPSESESLKRFIALSLSDTRMDQKGAYFNGDSLNPLPVRCVACGFLDLDFVPQPYFILRGPSMTPAEIGGSNYGYQLVKNRIKQLVECLMPGQCLFFQTTFQKSTEAAPWWLMMPVNFCRTGVVKPSVPRCSTCGEPASAHGTEYEPYIIGRVDSPEKLAGEIYKTANWWSAESESGGIKSWIHRDTIVSLRFYRLLRELKVTGVYEVGGETKPNPDEVKWVRDQIQRLKGAGIRMAPVGVSDAEAQKWFKAFLKSNAGNGVEVDSLPELEKAHKIKFPKSYLEFIKKVGAMQFSNIDSEEGLNAEVLLPADSDLTRFRQGQSDFEDEESRRIDGLMFATTDSGDCFCFDLKKDRKESEVFVYRHEYNSFEPYAENFIECLKRFTAGDQEED